MMSDVTDGVTMVLTVEQAARLLGVSHRTVLAWLRAGRLVGKRDADQHWRIRRADLCSAVLPLHPTTPA
jgi:excisionase family DNA binding protein